MYIFKDLPTLNQTYRDKPFTDPLIYIVGCWSSTRKYVNETTH